MVYTYKFKNTTKHYNDQPHFYVFWSAHNSFPLLLMDIETQVDVKP